LFSGGAAHVAAAAPCPGNPDALGVSRVMTVSAKDHARLGLMQYHNSLPLADHEVVLTFDDGPLPPYSDRVLAALAHECVKATFFLVGRHVAAHPDAARRVFAAGHTIGNHSQNHVLHFDRMPEARAEREVVDGARAIRTALGADAAIAPFLRIPGLGRTHKVEAYAQAHDLIVWSSDTVADDWTPIGSDEVLRRALRRLEARGRGILLLHDIHPRTVRMLPKLLTELKRRGFKIVHVVPERRVLPPQDLPPQDLSPLTIAAVQAKLGWPRLASADGSVVVSARLAQLNDQPSPTGAQQPAAAERIPLPPRKGLHQRLHKGPHLGPHQQPIRAASVADADLYRPIFIQ
jgi:peptidoglycan/xylan/chitin deacetylase (PgdA/CDA1 family)